MNKFKFLLAFVVGLLAYGSMALADQTSYDETPYGYEVTDEVADDQVESDLEDYDYPPPAQNRRCELIVVIVNLTNDYSRQRFTFWGQGANWAGSRQDAFNRYFQSINDGRFWRSNYNHSFAYRNCG